MAQGVSVDVSVRKGNQPVLHLQPSDFVLYDNNVRQTIESLSMGTVPIDVTIFLGTNNQTASQQLATLSADIRRIGALLRPDDRVRLLTLDNQVVDAFGWRPGAEANARITVRVGGVQSLCDACFLALMRRPELGRRHLVVVVTDGVEFGSVIDSSTLRDVAARAEGVLHLVLVDPLIPHSPEAPLPAASMIPPTRGAMRTPPPPVIVAQFAFLRASWFHVQADERGLDNLEEAAGLTGGTVRHAAAGESIIETFQRAFEDFRQTYLLRYSATGVAPRGWHDLRVDVAHGDKYTIRTRKGYFGG